MAAATAASPSVTREGEDELQGEEDEVLNEASPAKHANLVGDHILFQAKTRNQMADAVLAVAQQPEDRQAPRTP